jgi:hypothetical protein
MNKLLSIIVGAALFTATSVAHACFAGGTTTSCVATPGVTQVDFTKKITLGSKQTTLTTTAGGVDVTVTSTGGTITQSSAGLGVSSGRRDNPQFDTGESLTITFSAPVDIEQIVLNGVDGTSYKASVLNGSVTITENGKLVTTAVYDNVQGRTNAMVLDLTSLTDIIASSATITGGRDPDGFTLGSVCFEKVLPPDTKGVPELSKTGAMSTGLLLAGMALAFSGRRRRQSKG